MNTYKPQKAAFSQKLIEATIHSRVGILSRTRRRLCRSAGTEEVKAELLDDDMSEADIFQAWSVLPIFAPLFGRRRSMGS
jgi:hypothetical protein